MAKFNNERDTREFLDYKLARLPSHWRENALHKYQDILKTKGAFSANCYIRELVEPLENLLNIAHDDSDLKKLADDNTLIIKQRLSTDSLGIGCFDEFSKELCLAYGLRYPKEFEIQGQIMRLQCSAWWLRGLRNSHARAREVAAINAGLVHKKAALYCSDDTLERRTEQNKRNADMLAGVTMQSESGQKMNLAELAAKGMANPYNRAVELITRTKGFQELADKYQHKCLFLTITTPSRMHAFKHNGKPNRKYDGTKPDEAQRYLTGQWAKCRARLAREGVAFYGLRVVEPHHDATPHWHAAVWVQCDTDLHKMRRAVKDYFLRAKGCDYLEKGSISNRLKFKACDSRGAVGYMLKYILKNMKGLGIDGENSDETKDGLTVDSEQAASRVEAWATTWHIRQFQQIGGHSVSVWRELRRVVVEKALEGGKDIFNTWSSAQKSKEVQASFAEFIEAMGGLATKPRESIVRLEDVYLDEEGKYGAFIKRVVVGVCERYGLKRAFSAREFWHKVEG